LADVEAILAGPAQPTFDELNIPHVLAIEARTKHDVAAFVTYLRQWYGEPHARWIHFGMTSSDLVDTAQGLRFKAMMHTLRSQVEDLVAALGIWVNERTPILGRTHGQAAEPTMLAVRATQWDRLIQEAMGNLMRDTRRLCTAKLSGPVGTYAHNPPVIEKKAAEELHLAPLMWGATQIAPRGTLAAWANSASELVHACAKLAMDFRVMNTHGEVYEPQSKGQVGSSAMAGKNNPIRAEQITGMARLAAGYASMLQPLDVWLERDISHSSVERVAVPDLWHVVLHTMEQTSTLLRRMGFNTHVAQVNLEERANAAYLGADIESYDLKGDVERRFLSNWPQTRFR
jgi:adenylosuccinate lyase